MSVIQFLIRYDGENEAYFLDKDKLQSENVTVRLEKAREMLATREWTVDFDPLPSKRLGPFLMIIFDIEDPLIFEAYQATLSSDDPLVRIPAADDLLTSWSTFRIKWKN